MKKPTRSNAAVDELPADVSRTTGWKPARVVADPTTAKIPTRRVTINLDQDVVAIFKADALQGGLPYQVAINRALRQFLRERERSDTEIAADTVLKALENEAVQKKLRELLKSVA